MHWADGGETSLANTLLLCQRHHRRVHEEGWKVCSDRDGRKAVFFTPTGRAIAEAPPAAEVEELFASAAAAPLIRRNRARGVEPDGWAITQDFNRDADVPWRIEAAAREALDRGEEYTERKQAYNRDSIQ